MSRTVIAVLAALLTLAGCATTTTAPTAEQIVTQLAQRIPTATLTVVYTADTDPNDLLGRPGGYLSKAAFADSRIDTADVIDSREGSVDVGGSVEVFADDDTARERKDYLDALGPLLAGGYRYLDGPVLLRVSGELTPDQAGEYERALAGIV